MWRQLVPPSPFSCKCSFQGSCKSLILEVFILQVVTEEFANVFIASDLTCILRAK
jgi:hypothetical protein